MIQQARSGQAAPANDNEHMKDSYRRVRWLREAEMYDNADRLWHIIANVSCYQQDLEEARG